MKRLSDGDFNRFISSVSAACSVFRSSLTFLHVKRNCATLGVVPYSHLLNYNLTKLLPLPRFIFFFIENLKYHSFFRTPYYCNHRELD
jgi:hypothetical protein